MPGLSPPETPVRGGMSGKLKALLITSLTVNFLVLGAVLGVVIEHRREPPPPERSLDAITFGPLGGAFDRDDRAAMRQAARAQGADLVALRQEMRGDFARLLAALKADPFDPAALQAVLSQMQARTEKRMEMGQSLMLARVAAMTPEQRVALAERLSRGIEKFEHRFGDRLEERRERRQQPSD